MSKSFVNKALLGGAVAAGAAVWAIAPRTFSDKRRNYVPSIPDVWYAHRGLHDAGSGLTAQYANESGDGRKQVSQSWNVVELMKNPGWT